MLPQQPNLNVIERKFKRQILMPDPIILDRITFHITVTNNNALSPYAPHRAQHVTLNLLNMHSPVSRSVWKYVILQDRGCDVVT